MTDSSDSTTLVEDPFRALGPLPDRFNTGSLLRERALERPDQAAVRTGGDSPGDWSETSFAELEALSDSYAHGLVDSGLRPGDRTCLFVRPGADLVALAYALFKVGAVPVLIDPGMGRKSLLACVEKMRPRALIGVPTAHFARMVFPKPFRSVELLVTVGGPRLGWKGLTLAELERPSRGAFPIADTALDDDAAILFTSGSTGPPKGVTYTHGTFRAQVSALGRLYHFQPGEVDVACFPLFGLFDAAFGMTSVFPALDPSHPGKCDPARIVAALTENQATCTFGSPAIWRRVVPWCLERVLRLPHLRRVLVAGAPVPPALVEDFHRILNLEGDVYTPYGATEALPVTSMLGRELVGPVRRRSETGEGTCVGHPAPGIDVRFIRITDEPLERWSDDLEVEPGEMGEICVRGPVVTHEYKNEPGETRLSKIAAAEGQAGFWHRMGDVGYRDESGLVWFCGRKSHRVETEHGRLLPVPIENVYNTLPRVRRTALVGVGPAGRQTPVLVVEPEEGSFPRGSRRAKEMSADILRGGAQHAGDANVKTVLFKSSFPVDVRHNAKIRRPELAQWAAGQRVVVAKERGDTGADG